MPDSQDTNATPPHVTIGPYRVLSVIARRTHSAVYKVRGADGQLAVLKALAAGTVPDSDAQARFQQEIANLRRIDHPNVARILDSGVAEDGRPYIVLEYVDGPSLEQLVLDRVRLSPVQVMDLAIQACEGLRAALKEQVVHLDIKPGNLLVDSETHVLKIVDFGLSKLVWEPEVVPKLGVTYMGTPRYMSPEHCRGTSLDHRSDLYSLGATFYHLLAGRPPFDAPTYEEVMRLITTAQPAPLGEVNPDLPQDLCNIVMRLLRRDPNERFQDYPSAIEALDAARLAETARQEQRRAQADMEAQRAARAAMAGAPPAAPGKPMGTTPLGGHAPQASSASGVRVDEHEVIDEIKKRRGVFHPLALLAILVVIGLAVITIVGRPPSDSTEQGTSIFGKIASLFSKKKEEDPEAQTNTENLERMHKVAAAVGLYRSQYGKLPQSLSQMEEKGLIASAEAEDVWGNRFRVLPNRNVVLCVGPDGDEETADDWTMAFDGTLQTGPASMLENSDAEEEFKKKAEF